MKLVKIFPGTVISPSFSVLTKDQYLIPNSKSVAAKFKKFFSTEIKMLFKIGKVKFFPHTLSTTLNPLFKFSFKVIIFIIVVVNC